MNPYKKHILPKLIHCACRQETASQQRARIVPQVAGTVLEIGIGSGLNLPFYDPAKVKSVTGIDPSPETWRTGKVDPDQYGFPIEYLPAGAEDIPVETAAFDAILMTYTLCSIPDLAAAFAEFRRVLKPGGRLYFCEHGRAPDRRVQRWQDLITPVWKYFGGGCHLNRDIPGLITAHGFHITTMETGYISSWKLASFNYWGVAEMK